MRKKIKYLTRQVEFLKQKVQQLTDKKKKIALEDVLDFVNEHYDEKMKKLLTNQLVLMRKRSKGARYSNDYKQFALALYILGPKSYKYCSERMPLPSKSTLLRITKNWDIGVGFSDFMFKAIEHKVNLLDDRAKDCVICLDEMSLKSHLFYNITKDSIVGFNELHNKKTFDIAGNVLVVMARGIAVNWKQPVAYFFLKTATAVSDLKDILFETITRLSNIGLRVRAAVSDQGSNFYKLAKSVLKITSEKPYFMIDDRKIFYIFDVPHLLKSTRNNFFSHNFLTATGTTKKIYLEQMYEMDKQKQDYRLAHRLTNEHIYPNPFQKMKVKLAAQVFSHSVTAAITTYMSFNMIESSALATANFIEKMNELFDVLNSNSLVNMQAFMGSEKQFRILSEMENTFNSIKVVNNQGKDITNKLKFIFGWKITISAVRLLWQDLKNENYKFLFTRNLNQDCLENYFGQIRNACGNARNPTPYQFSRAFKNLFAVHFIEYSEGTNCIDDYSHTLATITPEYLKTYDFLLKSGNDSNPLIIHTSDYSSLDTPEGNNLVYIAGYLLKKCLDKKHRCEICDDYAKSKSSLDSTTIFMHLKAFENKEDNIFGGLKTAPDEFIEYLIKLEKTFNENFQNLFIMPNVGANLKYHFSNISFSHPCPHFPKDYLLSLYTRIKIYFTLRFINQDIKNQKTNKKKTPIKLTILQNR